MQMIHSYTYLLSQMKLIKEYIKDRKTWLTFNVLFLKLHKTDALNIQETQFLMI